MRSSHSDKRGVDLPRLYPIMPGAVIAPTVIGDFGDKRRMAPTSAPDNGGANQ